jgi:hypothetical protein
MTQMYNKKLNKIEICNFTFFDICAKIEHFLGHFQKIVCFDW